jgi:adenylylsulfate kinase
MRVMMQVAAYIVRKDASKDVILDGRTFSRRYQLAGWKRLAHRIGVVIKVIECVCSDETVKARLEQDVKVNRHPAANRDYAMYLEVKTRAEGIVEPKCVIDTEQSLDRCVSKALHYLGVANQHL